MHHLLTKLKSISPLYFISAGVTLLGLILLWVVFFHTPSTATHAGDTLIELEEAVAEDCEYRRAIDGVCVDIASQRDPDLVGIMIENHYEARPVSGLTSASVVYEAPVEGNYNRFFAVYPVDSSIKKVGPVRSARPYYLDWVSEYPGMMYMHVGGSPDALEDIDQFGIFDLNEFYRGWYYWRDGARYAPHNVYTSSVLWRKAMEDYSDNRLQTTDYSLDSWRFEKWGQCEENCVNEISTVFSGETYSATWEYNSSTEQYERFEFGEPVVDLQTGDQVVADTLIVQYVDTEVIDGVGRLSMETIGSGDGILFRNGFKIEGEWRKESREGRTKFYDFDGVDGNEIALKAGKIWIVVMNGTGSVSYE